MDSVLIHKYVQKLTKEFVDETKISHEKKHENLGINSKLQPFDPQRVIFNCSNVYLSSRLKFFLPFGLDFGVQFETNNLRDQPTKNFSKFCSEIKLQIFL